MGLLPDMRPAAHVIFAALLVGLFALARWLAYPVVMARKRKHLEHPSEDVFKDPGASGVETLVAFPRLSDAPTKLISVVVPAFDERQRLPAMLDAALDYLGGRARDDPKFTFELLVVDDGSTDGTSAAVMEYVARLGTDVVRLCSLHCNQGKGAATRKGMLRMRGQYGLMADADGATNIADLGRLLERLRAVEVASAAGRFGVGVGSRAHMESEAIAT
ncbi:unnamed protein product, partial [Phaeothamnion confervicola]